MLYYIIPMTLIAKLQQAILKFLSINTQIFTILAAISGLYLLFNLFAIEILIAFFIFLTSIYSILYFRWKSLRQKGIINMIDPQLQQVLLKRSIFDLYRDQIYFPYITKIISTFIKGAISKPHPEKLNELFDDLPQHFRNTIHTKGILKLAPEKLQQLVLTKDIDLLQQSSNNPIDNNQLYHDIVPNNYGEIDIKWDKLVQYQSQEQKIHEHTFQKQVFIQLNQQVHWKHIIPILSIVCICIYKIKSRKLGKMLLYQTSTLALFILILLVIIKYKKPYARKKLIKAKRRVMLDQQNK